MFCSRKLHVYLPSHNYLNHVNDTDKSVTKENCKTVDYYKTYHTVVVPWSFPMAHSVYWLLLCWLPSHGKSNHDLISSHGLRRMSHSRQTCCMWSSGQLHLHVSQWCNLWLDCHHQKRVLSSSVLQKSQWCLTLQVSLECQEHLQRREKEIISTEKAVEDKNQINRIMNGSFQIWYHHMALSEVFLFFIFPIYNRHTQL